MHGLVRDRCDRLHTSYPIPRGFLQGAPVFSEASGSCAVLLLILAAFPQPRDHALAMRRQPVAGLGAECFGTP
jgi:hypothetical protein